MAKRACHGFGSTTRRGLTQVLGGTGESNEVRVFLLGVVHRRLGKHPMEVLPQWQLYRAMLGGRIIREIGEIPLAKGSLSSQVLRVLELESANGEKFLGLSVVSKAPLAASMTPYRLTRAQAQELIALLQKASGDKVPPNSAFKPNSFRSTNSLAERACHAVCSATRVGLT